MMNFCKIALGKLSERRFYIVTLLLFSSLCLSAGYSYAQSGSVSGVVKDTGGQPMIGVNVLVKGSMNGTSTEIDGTFTLNNVDTNKAVLVFSYLGYAPLEVNVANRTNIDVTLTEDVNHLEEVVVVGYGSMSKKELSSSIVQVNKEDFNQGSVNSAMELLAGKVAGVSVSNTAIGDPNSSANIQIRGAGSINANNDPLYVIDGIAGGDIRSLSPQDIESITILKDAASSAIYGSRAANGVVLVTTKRDAIGDAGTYRFTYDSWFGVNTATGKPDILSADEFRRAMRGVDYGESTDWYSALLRDFSYTNNQYVSFDGSTQKGAYSASLNYRQATGLDIASGRKEYGGRFAVSQRALNDYLEFTGSLNARKVEETWGDAGMFDTAATMNPTLPMYNDDGSYYHPTSPSGIKNPLEVLTDESRGGERMYVVGNVGAKVKLFRNTYHDLNTSISYALDYNDLNEHFHTPTTSSESDLWSKYEGRAKLEYKKWWTNQFEWLLNYSYEKNDHTLRAVAGYSWVQNDYEGHWLENKGFDYDELLWHNIESGSALAKGEAGMASWKERDRQVGVFGRLNYSWNGIVMASASLRYEGSTVFGENNKWGAFPGVSAAVEFANMPFMEGRKDVVNSLKLRASYGATGRSGSRYQALTTYGSLGARYYFNGEWVQSFGPTKNTNPNMRWEKAVVTNIGVDFAFINRIRGSVEWFDKQSKDLLYTYKVSQPPFIYPEMTVNMGRITTRGVELNLEGDIFRTKDFRWTSSVVFSYMRTRLMSLSGDGYEANSYQTEQLAGMGTSEYMFNVPEGGYIGEFYGYEHAGISDDGYLMIYDNDGNAIPMTAANTDYKRSIGNGTPKFHYSWNNSFSYKNFDISLFMRGAAGHKIFNMQKYRMGLVGCATDNVLKDAYDRNKDVTKPASIVSSYYLENGAYLNIESFTLGYSVPLKPNKYVDNLRVYFSAKNLFTITGYTGNDPNTVTMNGLKPGIDSASTYPFARQWTVGLTVLFN